MRGCRQELRSLVTLLDIAGWHEYAQRVRHACLMQRPDGELSATLRRSLARMASDPAVPVDVRVRIWLVHDGAGRHDPKIET